jgi:hypothetical protein
MCDYSSVLHSGAKGFLITDQTIWYALDKSLFGSTSKGRFPLAGLESVVVESGLIVALIVNGQHLGVVGVAHLGAKGVEIVKSFFNRLLSTRVDVVELCAQEIAASWTRDDVERKGRLRLDGRGLRFEPKTRSSEAIDLPLAETAGVTEVTDRRGKALRVETQASTHVFQVAQPEPLVRLLKDLVAMVHRSASPPDPSISQSL